MIIASTRLTMRARNGWHPRLSGMVETANIARAGINLEVLFATPVVAVELPGAAALNTELQAVILVTDSSNFARSAPVRPATLAGTDHLPSPAIAMLCRADDVTMVETGGYRRRRRIRLNGFRNVACVFPSSAHSLKASTEIRLTRMR